MCNKIDYNFTVMYKNEEAAFVHISADHKEVSIKKYISDGIKQPFSGNKLDLERVYTFLKDRCFEDGYAVKYNGTEINIKTTSTDVFKKGDMVKFCVPCGNKRKAYFVVDARI